MIEKIKSIYEEVYCRFSGYRVYELNLNNKKNAEHFNLFCKLFEGRYFGSIDDRFILDFIVYQFQKYENAKTRLGKNRVYLKWILSNKSFQRWENKPDNWLYWNNVFIKKYRIQIPNPEMEIEVYEKSKKYADSLERNRFYGTERGLLHCDSLELFDRYSKECLRCLFKKICEK